MKKTEMKVATPPPADGTRGYVPPGYVPPLVPAYQAEGDLLAEYAEDERMLPDIVDRIADHLRQLFESADPTDPQTIRRVYPVLAALVDERDATRAEFVARDAAARARR
jgi:hypothetical protein